MVFATAVRDSQADKKELEGKGARLMSLMGYAPGLWQGAGRERREADEFDGMLQAGDK